MIIKLTNQDKNFYSYLGKIFGSRIIEKQTNDRIYDDDEKIWYVYLENEEIIGFVSIRQNIIKNIYASKKECLEKLLNKIAQENEIEASIVTNAYRDIYQKCRYQIQEETSYKNFITIWKRKDKKEVRVS